MNAFIKWKFEKRNVENKKNITIHISAHKQ